MSRVYTIKQRKISPVWRELVRKHQAIELSSQRDAGRYPKKAVAFHTANYSFILSARDPSGFRKVLVQL